MRNHSTLRPDAVLVFQPADGGREEQADFVRCVHCQRLWHVGTTIGSILAGKIELGFCQRCNGIHCPGEKCAVCVPIEQWLENVEAGRDEAFRPTKIAVPDSPIFLP